MFDEACNIIRESVYCCTGLTATQQGGQVSINATTATGFMVAPGVLATAAHFLHVENDPAKARHTQFETFRAPDIGQNPAEVAQFMAEDTVLDIGLLKINNARDSQCVRLREEEVARGVLCGFLGYPLASLTFDQSGSRQLAAPERFQGAFLSNYVTVNLPTGQAVRRYEIDRDMYPGSSGCPGFDAEGAVMGMQVASLLQAVPGGAAAQRVAISFLVPSMELLRFARANGVAV